MESNKDSRVRIRPEKTDFCRVRIVEKFDPLCAQREMVQTIRYNPIELKALGILRVESQILRGNQNVPYSPF